MPSSYSRRPRLAASLLAATAALTLAFAAAPGAAQQPPSFAALVAQAQVTSPQVAEAQAEVRRAEALALQAGYRPNPEASLEVENFAGTRPNRGFDEAEITLGVEQTFERGGKRPARVEAARAEVAVAQARLAKVQADLGADLFDAYIDAEGAQRRIVLAEESLALAQEDARIVAALVEAGREAEVRAIQAGAVVITARTDLDGARADYAAALGRLSALAGTPAPLAALPEGTIARTTAAPVLDDLATPSMALARAERDAALLRVRLEELAPRTDITVSAGVRRFQGNDSVAFLAGVSAPIPVFNRNQGGVAASRAEVTAADARLNAAHLTAESQTRLALQQIAAADRGLAGAREAERALAAAYEITRTGYEGGKLPLSEVTAARRSLSEARGRTLDAELARSRAQAALTRAHGRDPFGETN